MAIIIGAIILWIVPIFITKSIGASKNRLYGAAYGLCLGWLGVLAIAVLPPLPADTEPRKFMARRPS